MLELPITMTLLSTLLDVLFPKRPDAELVAQLKPSNMINLYQPQVHQSIAVLSRFQEPRVRACIHEAKFHNNEKAFELLSELLKLYLHSTATPYLIIPIPLSGKRQRSRGYNQVTQVLKRTLKETPRHQLTTTMLKRNIDTTPQTKLSRTERLKNVQAAFICHVSKSEYFSNTHILVVDDVATTGATLKAAEAALLSLKPASITKLALAH